MFYYRICDGLTDIGTFYNIKTSPYSFLKNLETPLFKSVYFYTEEQVKEAETLINVVDRKTNKIIQRKRGVGNITSSEGVAYNTLSGKTNIIIFDFDSQDLNEARKEALIVIKRLKNFSIDENNIDICFSGNKGFHLKILTDYFFTATEHKNICKEFMTDLKTVDTRVYNDARILRLPYTKHTSGYYSTPLSYDELLNLKIEDIHELAKQKFEPEEFNIVTNLTDSFIELKNKKEGISITKNNTECIEGLPENFNNIDFSKKPPYLSASKYILELGYIPRGFGQDARMILASSYKNAGKTKLQAYYSLKAVSEERVKIYGKSAKFDKEELWNNILSIVYSDSWNGGTYSIEHPLLAEIESKLPVFLKNKIKTNLITNEQVFSHFRTFATDIDKNTLKFGLYDLDKKLRLITGTAFGLLGCPGSGKSTLAMNLLSSNSKKGEASIFYSLDMNQSLVALKQIQRVTKLSDDEIFKLLKDNPEAYEELALKAMKDFENVTFSFKTGISPDDIRNDIIDYEQKIGKKIRLVIVDYLENIVSGYSDPMVGVGVAAQQLSDIGNELNVCMGILLQSQKTTKPGESIDSMRSVKGSSVIEQCLSVILSIHREGQPLKYQDYDVGLNVNILKNRYGSCGTSLVGWDGARSLVNNLTEDQRLKITELRELINQDKEDLKQRMTW